MNTPPLSDIPLPPGIRSRSVDNINGLRMHVLEAGFEDPGHVMNSTSPLEGEVGAAQQRREGGKPQAPAPGATPLPRPPPSQVGPARLAQEQTQPGQARVVGGGSRRSGAMPAGTNRRLPRLPFE